MSTTLNFSISGKRGTEAKKVEGKKWREKDVVIEKTLDVGGENFPVDTGRFTGTRDMDFSSSNGR